MGYREAIVALAVGGMAWQAAAAVGPVSVRFVADVATIRTDRYEVVWQNGNMVGLRTFLPREQKVTSQGLAMGAGDLPNGLALVADRGREMLKTYGVVTSFPLAETYPAYHAPLSRVTRLAFERIEGGARLTYRGLAGAAEAVLLQELTVESGSGDLVIRQRAVSPQAGATGIAFSLLNVRRDVTLAVPYFGGQRWDADYAPGKVASWTWPYMWNAGLVIGELPGGGCFSVWADDPDMRPKFFRRRNASEAMGLGFEACAEAPFREKNLTALTWRFNTFAGPWTEPARRYKDWMASAFRIVRRAERSSGWVDQIALVVPQPPTESALDQLGKFLPAKHLLFMDWGWLKGFNRRIPEYIPARKDYAEMVALAHRHGVKVGVYTSLALVDQETHPTMMNDYGLEYFFRGPAEEKPVGVRPGWLQYVHPGSARWREFYSRKMAEVVGNYGIDYLYQDVAGCAAGSSGLVEGLTFSKGAVQCEQAIRAAVPQAALGGEFWTDVNACREDFAVHSFQAWFGPTHAEFITRPHQPHPLLSYLFSDYCVSWPHQVSIRDTAKFHRDQNINEVTGAIPVWTTTPDDLVGEAHAVIERAKLFAEGFRPYFPETWDPHVVSYLRNPRGQVVKYVRPEQSTFCYEVTPNGDRLRYARLTGVSKLSLSTPATIDGWVAYDAGGPIGLNPSGWYCAFPGKPTRLPVTITQLPQGAWLKGVRLTDAYVLVDIEGKGQGEVAWQTGREDLTLVEPPGCDARQARHRLTLPVTLLFAAAAPEAIVPGRRLNLEQWQHNIVAGGQIIRPGKLLRHGKFKWGDRELVGAMVHPPTGGRDSEISIDGLIRLPDRPNIALRVTLGRRGGPGDGVNFVVRANGREVWRQFSPAQPNWREVTIPLGPYAGRAVVLSLALDCGPSGFNTSCDEAIWAEPQIVTDCAGP